MNNKRKLKKINDKNTIKVEIIFSHNCHNSNEASNLCKKKRKVLSSHIRGVSLISDFSAHS